MKKLRAHVLTILALVGGIVALRQSGNIVYDPEPAVPLELPLRVGAWRGETLLFCQKTSCAQVYVGGAETICTNCGGALGPKAAVEAQLLPPDTHVRHANYSAPGRPELSAILVISGEHRTSIHRPELCFAGSVVASKALTLDLPGRRPLDVRVLTLRARTASGATVYNSFAYWFVAKNHETASSTERILSMASDRILGGVNRRWAYVSVTGPLDSAEADPGPELREFLAAFVPQLAPR